MKMEYSKRILSVVLIVAVFFGIFAYANIFGNAKSYSQSVFAMDTYMEITVYGKNSQKAIQAAIQEIERLDALLSTGSDYSEVTHLNSQGGGTLSDDTKYLLMRSLEIYKSSEGAFDITIYPVMRAWGFTDGNYRVPDAGELKSLLLNVDSSKLGFDESTGVLTIPKGMEIDFGGIAKGYTAARVASIIKEYGVKAALINLGGNVQIVGKKTDGELWHIAIKTPSESLNVEYLGILSTSDVAVVTSGGYERYFEQDSNVYHHIIDTSTGYPADSGIISATIVCDDGTLADGLSTAVYCMGIDKASDLWRKSGRDFDMIIYDEQKGLCVTQGIADNFTSNLPISVILP